MGLILGGLIVAAPGISAAASSLDLFYERSLMVAADTRCGLLPDDVGSALVAAQVQARGAAMRAGFDKMTIKATQSRAAAKAGSVACASPDLAMALGRVRAAFDGYARLLRMDYPGDSAMWKADRGSSVVAARWRLFQNVKFGDSRMVFGLAGRKGANVVLALAQFPRGEAPYAANLVLRDDAATSGPYLDQRGATLASTPLARRLPPVTAQVTFAAEARSTAGLDLLPKDMKSGWAFRFPPEAARAMAQLDPREVVAVDFMFPGDVTRRAYVEVGDFAAGRAFLQYAAK
ncbi:MAG TPA: hypothetical protein PK913_15515 [Phenylobacterium sp.]|nr:hypothetical protein [Phenylobacterium sp.]